MKQVLIKKGQIITADIPSPQVAEGMIMVQLVASCISPGTERMGILASGQSLLQKALAQPDKARKAWSRMQREGIASVWRKARDQQEAERATGYSAAGVVCGVGDGVAEFRLGDRVAIGGAAYANHAEVAVVPVNMAVSIPDRVDYSEAATVALGAIALQGVRRAQCGLDERVVVLGCGALGLLAVQMLKAAGCRVLALDLDDRRLALAQELGAQMVVNATREDPVSIVRHWCDGRGADAVIITAATESNQPLSQAFRMSRQRGRVVLVGVVGKEFNRDEMYARELDFVISTSYGPGRYDEAYERWGLDYPFGYVRWTERRNMQAYLGLVARGAIHLTPLIGGRYPIEQAAQAYDDLQADSNRLLALLTYSNGREPCPAKITDRVVSIPIEWRPPVAPQIGVALVGVGGFVRGTHVPSLRQQSEQFTVRWIIDQAGPTARAVAAQFLHSQPETSLAPALADPSVSMILIGTRHNTHAQLTQQALQSGKAVFVEKPMCLTPDEYTALEATLQKTSAPFMVGYNRRFSPFARQLHAALAHRVNPVMIHYTMNAGYLPYDHWTQTYEGGGRIMGEACHIIDLFRFLVGSAVESIQVEALRPKTESVRTDDNCHLVLRYCDGSVCSLLYTAVGSVLAGKERLEAHFDEKTYILDDYLVGQFYGLRQPAIKLKAQDKGHFEELRQFGEAQKAGKQFLIPWNELAETWQIAWRVAELLRCGFKEHDL